MTHNLKNSLLHFYTACGIDEISSKTLASINNILPSSTSVSMTHISINSTFSEINRCQSLEELQELMLHDTRCALQQNANLVFADGNPNAKIMLVGEAPGADEDRLKKPFVGQSGQLLDKMLSFIGINREKNCYISNVVPWRPPHNRQPSSEEIAQCLPFIERHIELVQPKLLICVGGVASKALLNVSTGITRLRGQWKKYVSAQNSFDVATRCLLHPAFLMRAPHQKKQMWHDLLDIDTYIKEHQLLE